MQFFFVFERGGYVSFKRKSYICTDNILSINNIKTEPYEIS